MRGVKGQILKNKRRLIIPGTVHEDQCGRHNNKYFNLKILLVQKIITASITLICMQD